MSSNKNSGQTKYANSNLNGVFAKSSPAAGPAGSGGGVNRFSGMLVLPKVGGAGTRHGHACGCLTDGWMQQRPMHTKAAGAP
jgi:hypothetical protein